MKTNKLLSRLLLVLVFSGFSGLLLAQEVLNVSDAEAKAQEAPVTKELERELLKGNISALASDIDGGARLIDSFLRDVNLSSLFGGIDGDSETPISFEHNLRLGGSSQKNSKIGFVLHTNAAVAADAAMVLGEELTTQANQEINDLDDIEYVFSMDVSSLLTGNWSKKERELFRVIGKRFIFEERLQEANRTLIAARRALDQMPGVRAALAEDASFVLKEANCSSLATNALAQDTSTDKAKVENNCKSYSKATIDKQSLGKELTQVHQPYVFADLVANQPQFQFTASYRDRNDLVGASAFNAKLSYSFGAMNINKIQRHYGKKQGNRKLSLSDAYSAHLACLAEQGKKCGAKGSFSIALEYSDVSDQKSNFGGIDFSKVGGEKITGSIAYERPLIWEDKEPVLNFGAKIDFEEFRGDTTGNDRVLATATLTRKINDRLSIPLSISYANKGEFLGDVDKELSANLGLSYDFDFSN